jgi:uncharacterized protein (TIGR01777 family)
MRVLINGATGLIGTALCQSLRDNNHTLLVLSRSSTKPASLPGVQFHQWDPQTGPTPQPAFDGVDAVVNLAGEPLDAHRWSDEQKKKIRESRVITTKKLVDGMRSKDSKPAVFVSGSAVGFYGDRGDEKLDEDSAAGSGFMSEVCQDWEREASRATEFGIRVVQVRTGVVLSNTGGALKKMLAPFKLGLGGRLGSGRQGFPWIHIDDIAGIFHHAIVTPTLKGPINGVAPETVTNAEFTQQLARALHRPAILPVPETALRVLIGEMAEVLFASQRVVPKVAQTSGYDFLFPTLAPALANLIGDSNSNGFD